MNRPEALVLAQESLQATPAVHALADLIMLIDPLKVRLDELEAEAKEARDEAEQVEDIPNAHRLKLVGVIRAMAYQKGMLRCEITGLKRTFECWNEWFIKAIRPVPDLTKCPSCGGPADNGHDREMPPNVYACTKCSGNLRGVMLHND